MKSKILRVMMLITIAVFFVAPNVTAKNEWMLVAGGITLVVVGVDGRDVNPGLNNGLIIGGAALAVVGVVFYVIGKDEEVISRVNYQFNDRMRIETNRHIALAYYW